ncbi:FkbM family methyltransferase [Selenomonas sp.]|uniref:FkbM family methyltransferase n=1 Tax=Selenomonas sp. TaxID=2053611 RepID=UPI002A75EA83|nr:FkbM family methyltransferase [Selenomonas sp.]MDY3298106.1 FkbM family methyltransferase [Selenomonas sp.]
MNRTEQNRTSYSLPDIIRNVYSHLGDDLSRQLFRERLIVNFTGEMSGWRKYTETEMPEGKAVRDELASHAAQEMILFGAGANGKMIRQVYADLPWACFADNRQMGTCEELPIISFDDLCAKHKNAFVLVTPMKHDQEIVQQLMDAGFPSENIRTWNDLTRKMEHDQYFDLPQIHFGEDVVFIDAGGYDGATTKTFIEWSKGAYKKVYCFEPSTHMIAECKKNLADVSNVEVIRAGVSDMTGELQMFEGPTTAAVSTEFMVHPGPATMLPVKKIDDACPDATFIKMDIEGAELSALKGAADTIRRNKPQMAICLYHKREDIWELPDYILSLRSDYTFYIRHYTVHTGETILYAV